MIAATKELTDPNNEILAKLKNAKAAASTPTPITVPPIDQGLHAPMPAPSSPTPVPSAGDPAAVAPDAGGAAAGTAPPANRMPTSPKPEIFNSLPAVPSTPPPPAAASPIAPPTTANVDPVVNAPQVTNPNAPPPTSDATPLPPPPVTPFGPASINPASAPAIADPASRAPAVPPGATAPGAAASDTAAAEERMRRILALNEDTKAVDVPTTGFDDENNLIGEQISPADSGRLQQREGLADTQLSAIALTDRNAAAANHAGEAINPEVGDRLAKLRALQDSTLDKAANGPDRVQMGIDQLARFTKDSTPDYDLQRRKALNDAAAFGYTGSGRLNTQYGDLDLARERDMDSQKERLSQAALEGTIGDRQNLLNTLGQFGNDEASYEQQSRDEQRKERSWRTDQGDADVAAEYKKGDYLTGAEKDQRSVEEGQRSEQRGERAYQRSLSETALTQKMDAAKLQDELTQSEFGRDQERLNAGYAKDPGQAYAAAAQQAFEEGKMSADELKQIMEYIAQQNKAA